MLTGQSLIIFAGSILLLALSAGVFLKLLPACGIGWHGLGWFVSACAEAASGENTAADLNRERAALEAEIAGLESDVARLRCEQVAELPPPVPAPEPEAVEEEPEEVAEEKPEQCTPAQTAVQASEIVFVFDTSSSMALSIDLPKAMDKRIVSAFDRLQAAKAASGRGDITSMLRLPTLSAELGNANKAAENYPGEHRISVAKKVTVDAVDKAPDDIAMGLVSFNSCAVQSHGRFGPGERNRLMSTVRGLQAENATPLAKAVTQAAASLKGGDTADDFVNIVVLSDGMDSCGGDPCAAARQAKQSKPGLVINVVDLSAVGEIQCMATATGGFYRQRHEGMDLAELSRSVREAAGYEGAGLCRD